MKRILVTGASGYIGSLLVKKLIGLENIPLHIMGTDIRPRYFTKGRNAFEFKAADLARDEVAGLIGQFRPDVVVHLAAIVAPAPGMTREFIHEVEVNGTKKILEACVTNGVGKIVATSSGAAYGYHRDNPEWLTEKDALRGNEEFAYSWHKRLVEEMMARYKEEHPGLKQVILRVSTILGDNTNNDITNMFRKKWIAGVTGTDTPFVIIWDEDLVNCLVRAAVGDVEGIFNAAGDGIVTLREMARMLNKRFVALPPGLIRAALSVARPLKLSRYGPEQVKFVQYRPVLDNTRLKKEFGYVPQKSSLEAFLQYARTNGMLKKMES